MVWEGLKQQTLDAGVADQSGIWYDFLMQGNTITNGRIKVAIIMLLAIVFGGTAGYQLIEGWSALDALYMTVITLSTVGYGEVHPLSPHGRIFTILLILVSVSMVVYGVSTITAYIVEGELTDVLRRRKMQNAINRLTGHYIVCGYDKTGSYVIEELIKTKYSFVVIEKDPEKINNLKSLGLLFVEGDATHNQTLQSARVERAKGLLTALPTDAENLLVVFTAKSLNRSIRIISKAVEEEAEQKIRMAGAEGVVMPNYIGGLRMVSEMIRPSVVTFLDIMLREKDCTVRVEDIGVSEHPLFVGKTLLETGITDMEGIAIVALKDALCDSYIFNPAKTTVLGNNHTLVVMGNIELINNVKDKSKSL